MRYEMEGAKAYSEADKRIHKALRKAKKDWTGIQKEKLKFV